MAECQEACVTLVKTTARLRCGKIIRVPRRWATQGNRNAWFSFGRCDCGGKSSPAVPTAERGTDGDFIFHEGGPPTPGTAEWPNRAACAAHTKGGRLSGGGALVQR